MTDKNDALHEIIALSLRHGITLDEISRALAQPAQAMPSSGILSKLLAYLGGIFIFAGVSVFISMYWGDFVPAVRVGVTLGIGFMTFVMAIICLNNKKYTHAATPLLLMAMLLQPTGIFVMLNEYSYGGDPRHGVLYMAAFMLIQQGAAFWARRRTLLAFSTLLFGSLFFVTLLDIGDMDGKLIGIVTGVSLMCIAYGLGRTPHAAISPFWHLAGSVTLLWAVFDAVQQTPLEPGFLGLSAFIVFLSTHVRSRMLLLVGTLAMLSYIGYYTAEHFTDTLGWPIALVILGLTLIGLSSLALKLNNKYIKQPA